MKCVDLNPLTVKTRKSVWLAIVLSLILCGHKNKAIPQSDQPSHQVPDQLDTVETELDSCYERNDVRITIPEGTLAVYEEWIRETVEQSRNVGYSIVVSKLDNKLWFYKCGELDKEIHNIVVGPNPIDNKNVIGDGCTPEGVFYACHKNPGSWFHKAVQISYPDTTAARKGLARRIISEEVYDEIVRAIRNRKPPPMLTNLGGDICIHGRRISEGCMGIGSENMDYIFPLIEISKTPICIVRGTKEAYFISEDVMQQVKKSRLLKERYQN